MLTKLRFITTTGIKEESFDFEFPEDVRMMQSIKDVAKKLQLNAEDIVLAPPGGTALTATQYQMRIKEVINQFGTVYTIINRGIVGFTSFK